MTTFDDDIATIPANGQDVSNQDEVLAIAQQTQDVMAVADFLFQWLKESGGGTKDEIRRMCAAVNISTEIYTKAVSVLERTDGCITPLAIEGSTRKRYVVQEWAQPLTYHQIVAARKGMKGEAKPRETFGDYYLVAGTMELTSVCLAANPEEGDGSVRTFYRTAHGDVLLISGYFEAMFKQACLEGWARSTGNARYRVRWAQQLVPARYVGRSLRPVPPARPGASGQGVTTCESLAPGTIIPFKATVPGTHITPDTFEEIMHIAGEWVGFSPSAAHKGFGRFIVPECQALIPGLED